MPDDARAVLRRLRRKIDDAINEINQMWSNVTTEDRNHLAGRRIGHDADRGMIDAELRRLEAGAEGEHE